MQMSNIPNTYRYPSPLIRKTISRLLALALILMTLAIPLQVILAVLTPAPLCIGTALFTAILLIPLLMRTVLHPEIDVTGDGLILYPMLWPSQFVSWSALEGIVPHPLVFNDDAMGRVLHGKRYRRREGIAVVVAPEVGLVPAYRLVGNLAGVGNRPAFAISSTTHTDYDALVALIRSRVAAEPERT